jgi:hypothetical protein
MTAPSSRSSLVADVEAARAALDRAERALADHDRPTVEYNAHMYRLTESGEYIEGCCKYFSPPMWGSVCSVACLRALARLIGTPAVIDKNGDVWTDPANFSYARSCSGPVREAVVVEVETT